MSSQPSMIWKFPTSNFFVGGEGQSRFGSFQLPTLYVGVGGRGDLEISRTEFLDLEISTPALPRNQLCKVLGDSSNFASGTCPCREKNDVALFVPSTLQKFEMRKLPFFLGTAAILTHEALIIRTHFNLVDFRFGTRAVT